MLISFLAASVAFALLFVNILTVPPTLAGMMIKILVYGYLIWAIVLLAGTTIPMVAASGMHLF